MSRGLASEAIRMALRTLKRPTVVAVCRRASQTRGHLEKYPRGTIVKEGSGPRKERFQTLELSDLIVDLDAEDCPYVREFDEKRDGQLQRSKWQDRPGIPKLVADVRALRAKMAKDEDRMLHAAARPFHKKQVSDHDIMSVALLGDEHNVVKALNPDGITDEAEAGRRIYLESVMRENGIPNIVLNQGVSRVLPFMLHRQDLAASVPPAEDGPTFEDAIDSCKSLGQLRKLWSRAENTFAGFEFGPGVMEHIHRRCVAFFESGSAPQDQLLTFVNNLTIRNLINEKALYPPMIIFGLQLASRLIILPSILQYLQIGSTMGLIDDAARKSQDVPRLVGRGILAAFERGDVIARGVRQQIFASLTGQSLQGTQPGLFALQFGDQGKVSKDFELYVRLLGELGALRLLWYQWTGENRDVFVEAFYSCAQFLGSKGSGFKIEEMAATGDLETDARRDLMTINRVEARLLSARSKGIVKPSLVSLLECISRRDVVAAFEEQTVSEAVRKLSRLITDVMANQEDRNNASILDSMTLRDAEPLQYDEPHDMDQVAHDDEILQHHEELQDADAATKDDQI